MLNYIKIIIWSAILCLTKWTLSTTTIENQLDRMIIGLKEQVWDQKQIDPCSVTPNL